MAFVDDIAALGFTHHLRFDATSGTSVTDIIGSDDGTLGSNVSVNQTGGGDDGNAAVEMDRSFAVGIDCTVSSPTNGESYDNDTRADRSFVIIFYLDDDAVDTCFLHHGSRDAGLFLYQFAGDSLIYCNASNGGGANYSDASAASLSTGAWHMLTLVQDDSSDEINVYHNDTATPIITVDISSWTSETVSDAVVYGDFQGNGNTSDQRARLHNDSVRFLNQGRLDGKIDEVAYGSGITLTTTEIADLYDSWLNGGGDDHVLVPADGSVAIQLDGATITQIHVISPNDLSVSSTLDVPAVTQNHVIAPADLESVLSLDASTIDLSSILSTNDLSVSSTLDTVAITQDHVFAPNDGEVSSLLDSGAIVQNHILAPDSGEVSVSLDGVAINQVHVLSPDDGEVTVSLDSSTVIPENDDYTLAPDGLSVTSTLDTSALGQVHFLSPDDGSVALSLDTSGIMQLHLISPDDLEVVIQLDTGLIILPSTVSTATISLGNSHSGSIALGSGYSGAITLGNF